MIKSKYKICSECNLKKLLQDFPFENKELNQRRANCKDCKNAASKKAYQETKDDPESVARRIIKKCKERERFRLAKFVKRRDELDELPEVELTIEQFDLDIEWVLNQRDLQNNRCFYTDLKMIWSTGLIDENKRINPQAVTIERIDNNLGYIKDNCILVCWRANCFRGNGTVIEMLKFAQEINNRVKIIKIWLSDK